MFGNLISNSGGRGFVFAVIAFIFTAGFCIFDGMSWAEWLDYNKWIGAGFLSAKAVERAAGAVKKTP